MPTSERIVLDPSEAITGRQEFDITDWIDADGMDWGEASIEPIMAEKDRGDTPVDFRVPNREITGGLALVNRGTVTAIQARTKFQAKVSLFQKEGGIIRRVTNGGGTVYADVVDASLAVGSPAGYESDQDIEIEGGAVSFVCLPDFYEAEVDLGDNTESTLPELVWEETSISGDYPARCRIVVDDDSGNDQRGLIYGIRSRHYSAAPTAALAYQAESLDPIGAGTAVATTGASGGTAVKVAPLWPTWTSVLDTTVGGTAELTHTGTYRVFARAYVRATAESQLRLSWNVNDLVNPVINEPWTIPNPGGTTVGSAFYAGDLGEVRLDPSPVGTHRWIGQLDAQTYNTVSGTADLRVDRIWFVPADEGMGVLTSPLVSPTGPASLVAFDAFAQTTGTALSTQAAPLGGNWDEAGDTDDFTTTGSSVTRTVIDDSSLTTGGQFMTLDGSSTLAAVEVQVDVSVNYFYTTLAAGEGFRSGVLARYVDTNNWLMAIIQTDGPDGYTYIGLHKRVGGGVPTELGKYQLGAAWVWSQTVKLSADESGNVSVYAGSPGAGLGAAKISITADSDLATGGAIDDGKIGMYSAGKESVGPISQTFDNFRASSPGAGTTISDAVTYGSATTQLTTDGHYRLDSGGTAYGPVSKRVGDLPRLPVAGLEGRTTQLILKSSRGDFEDLPDSGIDDISARVWYSPSWLTVPDE